MITWRETLAKYRCKEVSLSLSLWSSEIALTAKTNNCARDCSREVMMVMVYIYIRIRARFSTWNGGKKKRWKPWRGKARRLRWRERDGTARADISRRSKTFAFLPARGNLRCAANVSLPWGAPAELPNFEWATASQPLRVCQPLKTRNWNPLPPGSGSFSLFLSLIRPQIARANTFVPDRPQFASLHCACIHVWIVREGWRRVKVKG